MMITKSVLNFYTSVETILTQLVRMIVSIASFSIGELAPLAAPLAPSFSIYLAMSQRLQMPQYVALIAAGTIEIVGMYSAKISVRCYRWNVTKTKTEPRVPQALSVSMTAVFYVVVLALALTIELIPALTALIFPAFTLISVSVYVNMAIDQNLRNLETAKAAEIELRQEKNGVAADIRQAKNELEKLSTAFNRTQQQVKNSRSELATLTAELTTGQQAKIDLEAELMVITRSMVKTADNLGRTIWSKLKRLNGQRLN
ncbi:MAG: hypothetical protein ACYSQZ_06655 [Planctomycetota bacterium]|jgi:hypothetical protein